MKRRDLAIRSMLVLVLVFLLSPAGPVDAEDPTLGSTVKTYTLNADFAEGTLVNLNYDDVQDQLHLDSEATPFQFIWVAASGRGTIIKIDTVTGAILGEYWSAPQNMAKNPSRTTVDSNGNVWAGNRDEASDGKGSVVHIGLQENGQCVDRNGNGVIDTSTGLGDIRPWTNTGDPDTNGGVLTAEDECIIHYVRTSGTNLRTLAVDTNNDIWAGGVGNTVHEKIDGTTGMVVPGTQFSLGCGGYGGLVDGNGILWSASYPFAPFLLRYDPTAKSGTCINVGHTAYGLGIDTLGNIWLSNYGNDTVQKIDPDGTIIGTFFTGGSPYDRGVAITPADNNVWVANSATGNTVSRLDNDGNLVATITVGQFPTGVAVDAGGKVWVTNYAAHNTMRIDPATNSVDLTVGLGSGAYPYNYSDMTGSTLIAPPNLGTWTVVHDSGIVDAQWRDVSWNSLEESDSSITVKVASSADGTTFGPEVDVVNGSDPGIQGQYLKVIVSFNRATTGESPILYDLTISTNLPPAADANGPYLVAVDEQVTFDGSGSSDPAGDPLIETWTAGGGTVAGSTFTAGDMPGIYDVCLTVNDGNVDSEPSCTIVVIYDPDAGFVTGGGWIDSPAGAYTSDPLLAGKATFGFVSKYKKGASVPTGNTEFQFHAAGLNFHSSSYDWLVVTGSNYAMFKGVGTINGLGEYKFRIWAGDDDPDTFRIKIWEEDEYGVETVTYDNGSDQPIGGGSIVIHAKR